MVHKNEIAAFIRKNTDLFNSLATASKNKIAAHLKILNVKKGEFIIKQGESGDSLYIVYSGKFAALVNEKGTGKKVGEISAGGCFGEAALVTQEPRNASVKCLASGTLLQLSRKDFAPVLNSHPREFESFIRLIGKRSRALGKRVFRPEPEKIKTLLSSVDILAGLDSKALAAIEPAMEWIFLPGGETLMKQGDIGDSMYILAGGKLAYSAVDENGAEVARGRFSRGDIIGELALLTGEPRSATVTSIRSCELIRFPAEVFNRELMKNPDAMLSITRTIANRLVEKRKTTHKKRRSEFIITLFPHNKNITINRFAGTLHKSLRKYGNVVLATKKKFIASLPGKKRDNYTVYDLLDWLYELEAAHSNLLLCADFNDPEWTEIVLHHTDHIFILADHKDNPQQSAEEIRYLGDATHDKSVILLYDAPEAAPKGTLSWLENRKAGDVHHVRIYRPEDFHRIARVATGRSVGVALGGGGAKGFAHIGMLRAFAEEGIPVDMIGGTSAGAIMAAFFASGLTPAEAEKVSRGIMVDKKILNDFTFPEISFLRGKKFSRQIRSFTQDRNIEDLWIPYFAVATSLTTATKKVFDKGLLWKAIRASASIPGILPPLYDNNELLVDGAMLDNVPGSVLRQKEAGIVISAALGSDTKPGRDRMFEELYDEQGIALSTWKSLFRKINIFNKQKKTPRLPGIIMRSTLVGSEAAAFQTRALADLYIHLPVEKYGLFDWKKHDEIIQAGYDYTKKHCKKWKKSLDL